MKKHIFTLAACVLGLLAGACKSANNNGIPVYHVDPHKLSDASFDDFYKLKEVIVLETGHPAAMVPGIDHIIFSENRIITARYWDENGGFFIFDKDGKFVNNINKRGNGPGEYGNKLEYFAIDQARPDWLLMCKTGNLYAYNFKTWEYHDSIPWRSFRDIPVPLPNGQFLRYSEGRSDYLIKLIDREGNEIKNFLPIPQIPMSVPMYLSSFARVQQGRVFVAPFRSNRVYEYHCADASLTELYRISIAGHPEFDFEEYTPETVGFQDNYKNTYTPFLMNMGMKYHFIRANPMDGQSPSVALLIAPAEGRVVSMTTSFEDRENELPLTILADHNAGSPVAVLYPEALMKHPTTKPDSWGSKLKKLLKEDDNPVILIYEER